MLPDTPTVQAVPKEWLGCLAATAVDAVGLYQPLTPPFCYLLPLTACTRHGKNVDTGIFMASVASCASHENNGYKQLILVPIY